MLIILDYKKSIIHFSYCRQDELCVTRGIYINVNNYKYKEELYFLEFPRLSDGYKKTKDFRYLIKSKFELDLYKIIILFLNKIIKYIFLFKILIKNKNIKLIFNIALIFMFLLTFYFLIGGSYNKINYSYKNSEFLIDEWRGLIGKFSAINLHNSQGFVNGNLAIINGINDYQVLVIKNNEENNNKNFYLAVYYDNIIFIDKNNNSLITYPYEFCKIIDKKYFIYKLPADQDIFIFKNLGKVDLKNINKFSLVLEDKISRFLNGKNKLNICSYLVLN